MSTYKGWEAEEKIAIDYLETCRSAVEDDDAEGQCGDGKDGGIR